VQPPVTTPDRDQPPEAIYRQRIAAFQQAAARLGRWDTLIVWGRAVIILIATGVVVQAVRGQATPRWLLAPAALFAVLAAVHGRVIARRARAQAAAALCEAGLDRICDRWAGKGDAGAPFQAAAAEHLYAADLDLYGKGGLFELLSVARTPVGQATLAAWLQAPAGAAVAGVAARVDLREGLALVAATVKQEVRDEALIGWAATTPAGLPGSLRVWRLALAGVAVTTAATAALWAAGVLGPWPFAVALVIGWSMARRLRAPVTQILGGVDHRADELGTLARVMALLERGTFQAPALQALRQALETGGRSASRRIARLRRLVDLLEGRRNQFAALLMAPLQATTQLALAVEAWRRAAGPAVARWMAAVGELEALASLATFRFERPQYPFPEIVDAGGDSAPAAGAGPPVFVAEELGHPLIPAARRVANDLRLDAERRLILVSGSNMSGKSTLLRTVGVNAVLALAGAPVCARRLTISSLALGATLRINDSLQGGTSRFYAELTRLKQIVDRAGGAPPLLFLLDEILHGTNSHDRRIGAEAIIRGLVARNAAGLVTTHDLALAEVAEAMAPRAVNAHLEDHLEAGVMTFDYRVKPGVVRKSNALELMRAVGLQV